DVLAHREALDAGAGVDKVLRGENCVADKFADASTPGIRDPGPGDAQLVENAVQIFSDCERRFRKFTDVGRVGSSRFPPAVSYVDYFFGEAVNEVFENLALGIVAQH